MNNELTADERKRWARTLYVNNGKNIKETAKDAGTSEATIRGWINEGEWDLVRRSLAISKENQISRFYELIEQLNAKDKKDPKDVDLIVKYTAAIHNLDTDNSVYSIIEAAELFITWMYNRSIPKAQEFTKHFQLFIKERKAA